MQAIVLEAYGEPEVLTLKEIPAPEPSAAEVLINVAVCGVNRADTLQRRGQYPPPSPTQYEIPGLEFAGTVERRGGEMAERRSRVWFAAGWRLCRKSGHSRTNADTATLNNNYQISQMVVKPDYQRQSLGQQILLTLINLAKKRGANLIILEARTSAVRFYQKLGFETVSSEYPSKKTGVM